MTIHIKCPACKAIPYYSTDVNLGDPITAENWQPHEGYEKPKNGDKIECPDCKCSLLILVDEAGKPIPG